MDETKNTGAEQTPDDLKEQDAAEEMNAEETAEAGKEKPEQKAAADTEEKQAEKDPESCTEKADVESKKGSADAGSDEEEEDEKKSRFGRKQKKEKKELEKKDEQIGQLTDRLQRTMAEFDNFRKRTEKEKASMYGMGVKDVIEKILPVIDNFERGFGQVADDDRDDPFVQGMNKIYKQFQTVIADIGVTPIDAVGKPFDPNLHNAVMHVDDDAAGDNVVVEELQKGYMYKDLVIRHSMVKVAN